MSASMIDDHELFENTCGRFISEFGLNRKVAQFFFDEGFRAPRVLMNLTTDPKKLQKAFKSKCPELKHEGNAITVTDMVKQLRDGK